ncbi:hypothetical protein FO440_09510 [Mucilaginibacter corticis]|uniref:Uncharacterized protein n=1 Tax=Mucilaginibacter corticis TaxID=2597670 RepID=A0A556MWZ1_9SPHI|nr:hypothetical protein [Mucilaginibacter corticis]TSJ44395.1 hypothetical protein FO440_09510 [Mucilaginibacter corticis]
MNPLKLLEPDEREHYEFLKTVFEHEFEETHLAFRLSGKLTSELLNLLPLCAFLFEEYGFPDPEYSGLLYQALTNALAQYLAVFHFLVS